MKAAILYNIDSDRAKCIAAKVCFELNSSNVQAFSLDSVPVPSTTVLPESTLYKTVDFCVIVGGDGTIMRFAKNAALFGKPVVGVNAGRLGYLADIEENELSLLKMIPEGKCSIENRMMLKVLFEDENGTHSEHHCINDAVISRTSESRVIDIYVDLYGERFNYRADGLIFSTATGSTAYSLSAGGPIVSPDVDGYLINPICAHSLNARAWFVSDKTVLKAGISEHYGSEAFVTFDWEEPIKITDKTILTVSASEYKLKLIRMSGSSFGKRLNLKFR